MKPTLQLQNKMVFISVTCRNDERLWENISELKHVGHQCDFSDTAA